MDNGTTSTDSASATAATQQATSTGRTQRPRKSVLASTKQAGQVKPTRGKGKKPARGSGRSRQQEAQPAPAGLGNSLMPRTASTESDYASVAHPIFMVTAAPKVEDISHEALTRWVDLRLEYEEIMRARCVSSGEYLKSVMRSVRNSFDDSFLETLCETKWDKSKDDLTDEFIWDWIMKTVRNFKTNALPNIDELFQDQLVMSMNKTDIDARVMDYFHLCNTIVKTNGLTALFSEEDGTKKKCKVLLNCLPGELKTRVKNEIDFRLLAAKSSVSELFKVVSEKALEIDREAKALAKNKRRPQTQETKQEMATRPPKRGRIVQEKQKSRESQLQTTQRPIFRTDSGQNQPGPKGGCWTCGGQHRQADCPEAPAGDATRTRKQKPGRHRKTKTD
ncbi:hypothetical protein PF010_g12958 [Phytophthora fragariae]|uniref:Uncharacterized protein n=1 Tax=Phytophthora fragariae TaxID=53985 RepID=A0A6G0L263_9STRA|nr:hypothetical protein PF010_g12958 [Phytophthora fragariae]KAE9223255.1 hypothetical protein PF004_g12568 [Phytophthora fragariae]